MTPPLPPVHPYTTTTTSLTLRLLLTISIHIFHQVLAHPQCLDFRAPFAPASNLTFCHEYSELGCCGSHADTKLKKEFDYIKSRVTSSDWTQCEEYVRVALCQRCSPYAAHIYDAESDGKPRLFPGLCKSYCETFHDKCRQIVWFLDPTLAAFTVFGSKKWFCGRARLDDEDYCYPDVTKLDPMAFDTPVNPLLTNATTGLTDTSGVTLTNLTATASIDNCLCLEPIKGFLANPLFARPAMDGTGRVFVAEQLGRVHIYDARKNEWKGLFLDMTSKAYVSIYPGDERGFLGMAFHPQFVTNGRFFVFYSMKLEKADVIPSVLDRFKRSVKSKVRVSEMKVKATNPDEADMSSERVLLELFQPFPNHNGGEIFFGPDDGYLYTFHGDGGAAGDPLDAGQNKSLLYGKVLRLDVDTPSPDKPYSIPPDNPFINEKDARPEIYAYGVRNIWRCGIDRGNKTTGILCGDVGQSKYEEIDLLKKGANYGWNAREGFECYNGAICGQIGPEELPITAYDHSVGKSICGGVFYRGCENPALYGQYIYGDYTSRRLFSLTESDGVWTNRDVNLCGKDVCQGHLLNEVNGKIMSFGEDEDGEMYVLTSPRALSHMFTGYMLKFVDPRTRNDPSSCGQEDTERIAPLPKRSILIEAGREENGTACPSCDDNQVANGHGNGACIMHGTLHWCLHVVLFMNCLLALVLIKVSKR